MTMKNYKWIIFLILILLYGLIVFRYIQKKPSSVEKSKEPAAEALNYQKTDSTTTTTATNSTITTTDETPNYS